MKRCITAVQELCNFGNRCKRLLKCLNQCLVGESIFFLQWPASMMFALQYKMHINSDLSLVWSKIIISVILKIVSYSKSM